MIENDPRHFTAIGVGTNLGDRHKNLNRAYKLIAEKIGAVVKASAVYETAAEGFNGADFLNSCLVVNSPLEPGELLNRLQAIEQLMGRGQKSTEGYSDRVIDLDILFYDDQVINSTDLTVPHPHMTSRNFVMQPLAEIIPDYLHPLKKISVQAIADKLPSAKATGLSPGELVSQRFPLDYNFIAVEGNIGAGKTSLVRMLSQDYGAQGIYERYADNPFLPKFYKDQQRYAFPLEMSFLADRYQQLADDISQQNLFRPFKAADYYVIKSLIFSQVTLDKEEYKLYKRLFYMMYKELIKPELYVYLYQDYDRLLKNIANRGRGYEQDITRDYLRKIHEGYMSFIKTQDRLNIKVLDITAMDFVNVPEDYNRLLSELSG